MEVRRGLSGLIEPLNSKFWIEAKIDEYLERLKSDYRTPGFHASSAGDCPRLIQLSMNNIVSGKADAKGQRIFDVGKDTHLRYGHYLQGAKILVGKEVPITINVDDFVIVGSVDFVLLDPTSGKKVIAELKTINNRRFGELLETNSAKEENYLQWNIYSKGLDIPDGVIIYENKDTQVLKLFSVVFSQEKFDETAAMFRMINECNKKCELVPKPNICQSPRYCRALSVCNKEK